MKKNALRKFTPEQIHQARVAMESWLSERQQEALEADERIPNKRFLTAKEMLESLEPENRISEEIYEASQTFDFQDPNFSWKGLRSFAARYYRELGEAQATQAFGQLFRVGILPIAQDWYKRTPVNYPLYVLEAPSKNRQEFYAPLYPSSFPSLTGQGEPYSENQVKGLDIEIINLKWMGGETFTRELFDDDQTGQIRGRAQRLGEGQKIWEEAYVAARLSGLARTIGPNTVAASAYTTTNKDGGSVTAPFSTTMYSNTAGDGNKPAAFGQLSMPTLKAARVKLLNARDPLGIKLLNDPRTLIVSSQDVDNVALLAHSEYYPAVTGRQGENLGTAASGFMGGAFSKNPYFGLIDPILNLYLQDWEWYLGTARKGMVFQRRDALEVVQEVPMSGASFNVDAIRLRSRARWEVEWVDARFWFQGNDGSAIGVQ